MSPAWQALWPFHVSKFQAGRGSGLLYAVHWRGFYIHLRTPCWPRNLRTAKRPQISFLSISFRPVCGPLTCTRMAQALSNFSCWTLKSLKQFSCYSLPLKQSFLGLLLTAGSFFSFRTRCLLRGFLWLSCHHAVCNFLSEHYIHFLWTAYQN